MNNIFATTLVLLSGILPTLGQAPVFGSSSFFNDVETWMAANSKDVFLLRSGNARITVFDGDNFEVGTYMTSTAGDTIVHAAAANPDADFVINGAIFNYAPRKAVTIPLFTPAGNVADGGVLIHNTAGTPSEKPAKQRYWFGQQNDTSPANNAGSAESYKFGGKGHPTPIGSGNTDLGAAHGGLFSLIWEKGGSRHKQTTKDDGDLSTYRAMKVGYKKGYGIIGVDRDTGLLFVVVKENWSSGSIWGMQDDLFDSGADRAVLVDGGGSVGYFVRDHGFYIKSKRHRGTPSDADTVPSYILFKRK